jgi:hypothetical protein
MFVKSNMFNTFLYDDNDYRVADWGYKTFLKNGSLDFPNYLYYVFLKNILLHPENYYNVLNRLIDYECGNFGYVINGYFTIDKNGNVFDQSNNLILVDKTNSFKMFYNLVKSIQYNNIGQQKLELCNSNVILFLTKVMNHEQQ